MDTKRYVLTVVYPPDESLTKLGQVVDDLLAKAKIKVVSKDDWGQKSLAYPIKKHEEAVYHHLKLTAKPSAIEEFKSKLRLEHGILRWLLINEEEVEV